MGTTINWEKNFEEALKKSKETNKFVVLDFFNPN
jgi:hypothetical protein